MTPHATKPGCQLLTYLRLLKGNRLLNWIPEEWFLIASHVGDSQTQGLQPMLQIQLERV